MAITFLQEKKRQRYLILALALVIFVILLIAWKGFFKEEEPALVLPSFIPPTVEIDWSVLQSSQLTELQALATTTPFEGETGRENPFLPY